MGRIMSYSAWHGRASGSPGRLTLGVTLNWWGTSWSPYPIAWQAIIYKVLKPVEHVVQWHGRACGSPGRLVLAVALEWWGDKLVSLPNSLACYRILDAKAYAARRACCAVAWEGTWITWQINSGSGDKLSSLPDSLACYLAHGAEAYAALGSGRAGAWKG